MVTELTSLPSSILLVSLVYEVFKSSFFVFITFLIFVTLWEESVVQQMWKGGRERGRREKRREERE